MAQQDGAYFHSEFEQKYLNECVSVMSNPLKPEVHLDITCDSCDICSRYLCSHIFVVLFQCHAEQQYFICGYSRS
jgi:hypothetical protein